MRLHAAIASVPVVMLALYSGQAHAEPETPPIVIKDSQGPAPLNLTQVAEIVTGSTTTGAKAHSGQSAAHKILKAATVAPKDKSNSASTNSTKLRKNGATSSDAAVAARSKTKADAKVRKVAKLHRHVTKPHKHKVKSSTRRSKHKSRLLASVDLTRQRMTVSVDGSVKYVWPISSGRAGYHTPRGTYKPYRMHKMWRSRKYNNAKMPHSVFYRGGFAVHATYATSRLGSPASHGCVRLSPSSARKFYNLVKTYGKSGTTIKITGTTPVSRRSYASRRYKKRRHARRVYRYGNSGYAQQRRRRAYAARRTYYAPKPKGLLESLFD